MNTAENKGRSGGRNNRKGSLFIYDETKGFTIGQQYYSRKNAELDLDYWTNRRGCVGLRIIDKVEYDRLAEEAMRAGRRFG